MRKHQVKLITFMLLILLVTVGCGKKETSQKVEEKIIPVEIQVAQQGDITESIKLSGTILPNKEINVVASMGGKVEKVYVQVGQTVKKDANLVKLDSSEVERQVKQAQEGVKSAEAGLKVSELTIEPVRNSYIKAKETYERIKGLYDKGIVSVEVNNQTLKGSEDVLAQTRLQYIQVTGDPEAPKNLRKTSMQAEVGVKQAKSNLEAIQAQLNNTRFTSPIKGTVAQVNATVGNLAAPSVPMVKVIDIDKVVLKINLPEAKVSKLKDGQVVAVEIGSLNEVYEGTITAISPQADQMSKDFPVEITIENSDHKIKPGMTANAVIPVAEQLGVVLIAKKALLNKDGIEKVFVIKGDNEAIEKTVETGLRDKEKIEIITGIKEGDVVIVNGQHSLKNKSRVKISD